MATIFPVRFTFNNMHFTGLVSVGGVSNEQFYHVQLFDSYPQNVLWAQHIRYAGKDGYKQLKQYKYATARKMLECIVLEVEKQLRSERLYEAVL